MTVWTLLDKNCRATENWGLCHHIPNAEFVSKCMVEWPSKKEDCTTGIWKIDAHWQTEKIRQALITAVAGALEAVTLRPVTGPTNCYDMAGTKGCNVGDVVRVNFPESSNGEPNFMHVRLWNSKTWYGDWDCCEGDKRQKMDVVLDYLGNDIKGEFDGWKDKDFTRDSRCIIDGWKACP
ncbi:hypothetical protein BDU57DRAFT_513863 [Ampelomyces quisqualis]|uniref:Uncharacterized protein n=1 Tax=Ampelomyces quisqualis TaxID=50730 RepID=A0A6A5QQB4_AMPQU|nr:hypothetical protein BDU57DRAFT_513863 [Ampelomyces quisqualis]